MSALKRLTRVSLVVGLVLLAASSLRAEVRVQTKGHEAEVVVRPTEQGPWTPLGVVDASLLNPSGDYLGDGYPVLSGGGDTARVAWSAPATGQIHFAEWTGTDWSAPRSWTVQGSAGSPRLLSSARGAGSVLAWLETGDVCTTVVAATEGGDPVRFEGEALLAAALTGSRVEVLTLAADGALLLGTGSLPDVPGPIGMFERTVLTVSSAPVECPPVAAAPFLAPSIETLSPEHSLVTWCEGGGTLAFCVSGPNGVGPVRLLEHPGRGVTQPSVLRVKARKLALESLE